MEHKYLKKQIYVDKEWDIKWEVDREEVYNIINQMRVDEWLTISQVYNAKNWCEEIRDYEKKCGRL